MDKSTPALTQVFFTSAWQWRDDAPSALLIGLLLGGLLLGSGPSPAWGQTQGPRPIQAQDLARMEEVRDVRLSPHGRFVAYTVRGVSASGAQSDSSLHRTQLYVTPTSGRRPPQLFTRGLRSARDPAWHPDGTHLAYVQPVAGTPQVFVVSLSGGPPYQLTDTPHGAQRPQWSPDGERLLFASRVPEAAVARTTGRPAPSERPGRAPQDLHRPTSPDTLLVLRHTQTLAPLDTLAFSPTGRIQLRADSTRPLRTPRRALGPDSLAQVPVDTLAMLTPDSLRSVFDTLRLRPDTVTVPVRPDTAATPDGNLTQMRRWMRQNRRPGTALVSTRLNLQGSHQLQPSPTYRHHFVVDVPSGLRSGTPMRPDARSVTGGFRSYGAAEWLPGSGQLVVSGTPSTDRPIDRVRQRNLYVVDLNRTQIQRLLRIDNYALTDPDVTVDGNTVAFQARALSSTRDEQARVGLFALDGRSQPRFITGTFDRSVDAFRWSPNGWFLYATAASEGAHPLFRFTPFARDTSAQAQQRPTMSPDRESSRDDFSFDSTMVEPAPVKQLTGALRSVRTFDVTDATVVYASTDPDTPSALYTNTVSFNNEQQLAAPNADWLARRQIATPERLTVSHDSLMVTGWATRPPTGGSGQARPWLVKVRGGPPELETLSPPATWFARQYLAGRGLGLLEVFARGSEGFGSTFQRANDRNWGPGPARDVLALTDSVATLPWTDSTRVALSGTGYGASVATWLLGQTDRFRAAVALNGVYDLPALLDEGQAWRVVPQEFEGYPWDGTPALPAGAPRLSAGIVPSRPPDDTTRTVLHRNSPLTYAHRIHTPLLLLQGGANRRVGLSQSERLYKRLKILGRPVEYVRYPGVGHEVSTSASPMQRMDRLVRTYEFLMRFFSRPAEQ